MRKFKIGTEIRKLLLSDKNITDKVGNRIFPLNTKQDTPTPFIIYYRDRYSREKNKLSTTYDECSIVITVVDNNYDNSQQLAEDIDKCLDKQKDITYSLDNSTEDFVEDKYLQILIYKIK